VLIEDLTHETIDLLSIGNAGEARSLNRLAELAARQVPACSGATAVLWRDRETICMAASHPDLAEIDDLQLRTGRGPLLEAVSSGGPVSCADTLDERRWPEYARVALCLGVRCSATLVHDFAPMTVALSLYGVRPHALDADRLPVAVMLTAFGGATLANASVFDDAQRTAVQLRDAVESRSVVDQAKGILMHALGCDAADALRRMREVSQRQHIKVTEVASRIISAHGI
jgi:hypothetical protein